MLCPTRLPHTHHAPPTYTPRAPHAPPTRAGKTWPLLRPLTRSISSLHFLSPHPHPPTHPPIHTTDRRQLRAHRRVPRWPPYRFCHPPTVRRRRRRRRTHLPPRGPQHVREDGAGGGRLLEQALQEVCRDGGGAGDLVDGASPHADENEQPTVPYRMRALARDNTRRRPRRPCRCPRRPSKALFLMQSKGVYVSLSLVESRSRHTGFEGF